MWAIAALNPELFEFRAKPKVVIIRLKKGKRANSSSLFFCLPAASSTSSAQQDPSSTSSQDHQETGLHRFRNCTVNKDADGRTKQHPDNTTKTTSAVTAPTPPPPPSPPLPKKKTQKKTSGCFYPHIPRFLSRLDKMNTSPQPAPSYQLFFFFFFLPFLFFAFSLTMMQSATREHVAQMSSHWIYRCCPPFKTLSGCCVQTDNLGPAAIFRYWPPPPPPHVHESALKNNLFLFIFPLCTEVCIYDFILFRFFSFCMWFDHDTFFFLY